VAQEVTTVTCVIDLAVCPVSFDALVMMVKADIYRREINGDRLHVCAVGNMRMKSQYDEHEARWRLWNIVLAVPQLLNATVSYAPDWLSVKRQVSEKDWKQWPPDWDRQTLKDRRHLIGSIIEAARHGLIVPTLKASEFARRKVRDIYARLGGKVVTMTLRETYLKERNSVRGDWDRARRHIESKGYAVAILEDTSSALAHGSGYGELNVDLRMAMYQEAELNLQANNGAASLCWFSDKPWRMFGAGVPAEEWKGLFVDEGLPLGETWPWSSPQQKIVYGHVTADQIISEFDSWALATK
jgi:hypothetical protein